MTPQQSISKIQTRKMLFFLAVLVSLLFLIVWVKNLLISSLIGIVAFFLINPWVEMIERRGISRLWATLIPFMFVVGCVWLGSRSLLPTLIHQFDSLKNDVPRYVEGTEKILSRVEDKLSEFIDRPAAEKFVTGIREKGQYYAQQAFSEIPDYISNSLTVLFLAPFLSFFLLLDGSGFSRFILSFVPNSFFELALNLNHQISTQLGGFIRARLVETVLVGLIVWVGLLLMGFPYALVLAISAGLLNLIPYIGPVVGAVPAFFLAMIKDSSGATYAGLTAVYLGSQVIDAVVIVPFLVAKIVNLHAVIVVLAVIIGGQAMGILGMIISIPLASVLKVTFQALYAHFTDFKR